MAENNTDTQVTPDKFERLSNAVAMKADKIKYLVLAAVIIVIAAVAIFSYTRRSRATRETAAQNQVFQSIVDMQSNPETADGAAVFGKQAKEFAGLPAGAQAQLLQFAFAYNAKDFAGAEQAARDFIRTYPKSGMVTRVRLALGQTLLQQNRIGDAVSAFREIVAANEPETFPEAKLALAQALERDALQAQDNPDEYRRRLETAEREYNDIISRSRIVGAQRGFWPQAVVLPADYALVQIKDKLAGHTLGEPATPEAPITPEEREAVMGIAPPSAGTAGTAAPAEAGDAISAAASAADAALVEAATAARDQLDAAAVTAGQQSVAARSAVGDIVKAGFDNIIDASDAARRSLEAAATQASARMAELAEDADVAAFVTGTREAFDASVKTGVDAINSAATSARSLLDATVAKVESIAVAKDVIDLQGQTGLGLLTKAANEAVQVINDAAAKAALGLSDAAGHDIGHAAQEGYDAIERLAGQARTALEQAAKDAVAMVDELAGGEGAPNEVADAISQHVTAARTALESTVKSGSDAIAGAFESAVAAIGEAGRTARAEIAPAAPGETEVEAEQQN